MHAIGGGCSMMTPMKLRHAIDVVAAGMDREHAVGTAWLEGER
jgi:hypothetical protein